MNSVDITAARNDEDMFVAADRLWEPPTSQTPQRLQTRPATQELRIRVEAVDLRRPERPLVPPLPPDLLQKIQDKTPKPRIGLLEDSDFLPIDWARRGTNAWDPPSVNYNTVHQVARDVLSWRTHEGGCLSSLEVHCSSYSHSKNDG